MRWFAGEAAPVVLFWLAFLGWLAHWLMVFN